MKTRFFFLLPQLLIILLSAITNKISAQQTTENELPFSDSLSVPICGNLHEFRTQNQLEYEKFKNNQPSRIKNLEDYDPESIFQCGSFTVAYADIDNATGDGFDHPTLGEARRNTFCAVLNYVESVLNVHPDALAIMEQ